MAHIPEQEFIEADLNELRDAKTRLEYPSLTAKIADLVGKPIEVGFKLLPKNWNEKIGALTQSALLKGLEFSIYTMGKSETRKSQDWLHKLLVVSSGAASGAIGGFASIAIELPFSTCVILRSIADIARSEALNIGLLEIKLECLEVLALGGKSSNDDAAESGYWVIRGTLAKSLSEAASFLAAKGLAQEGAPPLISLMSKIASQSSAEQVLADEGASSLINFIAKIAARFSIVITEEAAATAIPIIGAISAGAINYIFMNHFQEMARGHFVIKRLEKKYGMELVEKTYKKLAI